MSIELQARLLQYAQDGQADKLQEMLQQADEKPSFEFVDAAGMSPLMYAASKEGNTEVLEVLLTSSEDQSPPASVNYQSPTDGRTALHVAAHYGALDAIELLIALGADATIVDAAGNTAENTPIHEESSSDARQVQSTIYSAVRARDHPVSLDDGDNDNPSADAENGAEEAASGNPEADRMLHDAAAIGDAEKVKQALSYGAHVESADSEGRTSLMLASAAGHVAVVDSLLTEGAADVNTQYSRSNNDTALIIAIRQGQVDVVDHLLRSSADARESYSTVKNSAGQSAADVKPLENVNEGVMMAAITKARGEANEESSKPKGGEEDEAAAPDEDGGADDDTAAAEDDAEGGEEEPAEEEPEDEPQAEEEAAAEEEPEAASADGASSAQHRAELESALEQARLEAEEEHQAAETHRHEEEEQQHQEHEAEIAAATNAAAAVAAAASSSQPLHYQPPQHDRHYSAADGRVFLELGLPQALQVFAQRYKEVCEKDFNTQPNSFILASIPHIAYAGQALLLSGASSSNISLSISASNQKHSHLTDAAMYPLLEVLCYAFPNLPLQQLDLSFNHLNRSTAQGIAGYLSLTSTLTTLELQGNNFDRFAGELLAEALLKSAPVSLTRINLNTNPLGPYALSKFATLISVNQTITDLDLGNTDCETLALMKLGTALQSNRKLKRLNLDNPLLYSYQEETLIHLSRCLAMNATLQSLSLKGHRITDTGAMWLSEYLLPNRALIELNLGRNQLTTTGVARFIPTIAKRNVECVLHFDGNLSIRGQTFEEINDGIADMKMSGARNVIVWNSKLDRHSLRAKTPL